MSDGRPPRREKWAAAFVQNIKESVVELGRPISLNEMFSIYRKFGKKLWSQEMIEKLIAIATSTDEIVTIELKIPDNKNLVIYPKRHRVSSTIFFAIADKDIDESTDLAMKELNRLVKIAEEKEGIPQKVDIEKEEINEKTNYALIKRVEKSKIPEIKHSVKKYSFKNFTFISQKMIRCQILHFYLMQNYWDKTFAIKDVIQEMPISFLCKICGVSQLPPEFYMEPNLRHIQLKFFPARIQKFFDVKSSSKTLMKIVEILVSYNVLIKEKKRYSVFSDPFDLIFENGPPKRLDFRKENDILYFWRFILITTCPTKANPLSESIWKNEWSLVKSTDAANDSDYIISLMKNKNVTYENVPEVIGVEREKIKTTLIKKEIPTDISFFCKTNTLVMKKTFDVKKLQLISLMSVDDIPKNNFMSSFLFCVASGIVTIGGVKCPSFIPWDTITQFMNEIYTNEEHKEKFFLSLHSNSMWSSSEYKKSLKSGIAFTIAAARKFSVKDKEEDSVHLCLSDIESLFSINRMMLRVNNKTGELVEGLKRRFMSKIRYYSTNSTQRFLSEFDWNYAEESMTLLRLINYIIKLRRENIGNLPVFVRNNVYYMGITRDKEFYEEIQHVFTSFKRRTATESKNFNTPITPGFITLLFNDTSDTPLLSAVIKEEKFSKFQEIDHNYDLVRIIANQLPLPFVKVDAKDRFSSFKNDSQSMKEKDISELILISCTHINNTLQLINKHNLFFFAYFAFARILQSCESGIDLSTLIDDMEVLTSDVTLICSSLEFLIEYDFISQISSCSVLPCFVANYFLPEGRKSSRVGHIFTRIDGATSSRIACETTRIVFDFIQRNRGCLVSDIQGQYPHLSLQDIFHVLAALEADEAIYCQEAIEEDSLFESTSTPCSPSSPIVACYNIWLNEVDKERTEKIVRRYYATQEAETRIRFLGDN